MKTNKQADKQMRSHKLFFKLKKNVKNAASLAKIGVLKEYQIRSNK